MLEHGGRLRQAVRQYGIPLAEWLDLSTGINPRGWPIPNIPNEYWQRLPEDDDELLPAARRYYRTKAVLAVAGSQAAIQALPGIRGKSRVGMLHPAYAEHAAAWRKAGHDIVLLDAHCIEERLDALDVLVLINPNNPTGTLWNRQQLLAWHQRLSEKNGWLLVDEAFIDPVTEHSLAPYSMQHGLIVLRSIGKFFGLAGVRCGFVLSEPALLESLANSLGPWTVNNPGRFAVTQALQDYGWQQAAILDLQQQGRRLRQLLTENGWHCSGCDFFQWIKNENAQVLHEKLAGQGILTRLFHEPAGLRFGLPKDEMGWNRLQRALATAEILNLR